MRRSYLLSLPLMIGGAPSYGNYVVEACDLHHSSTLRKVTYSNAEFTVERNARRTQSFPLFAIQGMKGIPPEHVEHVLSNHIGRLDVRMVQRDDDSTFSLAFKFRPRGETPPR